MLSSVTSKDQAALASLLQGSCLRGFSVFMGQADPDYNSNGRMLQLDAILDYCLTSERSRTITPFLLSLLLRMKSVHF